MTGTQRPRIAALAAALLVLGLLGSGTGAAALDGPQRIHLLTAADGGHRWSTVADDPEAPAGAVSTSCGARADVLAAEQGRCRWYRDVSTGDNVFAVDFAQGAVVETALAQTAPITFRLGVDVLSAAPHSVHLAILDELGSWTSGPATKVAPGIWEGQLDAGYAFTGDITEVAVEVRTQSPRATVTVHGAGASWLELPTPIQARSVPELIAAAPAPTAPTVYRGGSRTLWLADEDFSSWTFQGDLTQTRRFAVPLDRPAPMLLAWVDAYDTPLVHDVARGRPVDDDKVDNTPRLRLTSAAGELAVGSNGGVIGYGQDQLAAVRVTPAALELEVSPSSFWQTGPQDRDYEVHVVAIHGQTTLRRMRWTFGSANDFSVWPATRVCTYGMHQIPRTAAVTSLGVALDVDSAAPGLPDWTIRYDALPLGEAVCGHGGDRLRLVHPPRDALQYLGPVPEAHSVHVSTADTVFELDVSYTY